MKLLVNVFTKFLLNNLTEYVATSINLFSNEAIKKKII